MEKVLFTTDFSDRPEFSEALLERVRHIKHIGLDMDGTLYEGKTLFPYSVPSLNRLKEMGIGYSFLTNNPSKSVNDYLKHLEKMGIPAVREEFYTSAQATIDYLKTHMPACKKVFIMGTPSLVQEFEDHGFISVPDDPQARPDVLVVAFDMSLTYAKLCRAAYWAAQGIPYIATNPDRVCPTDQPTVLVDCGSMLACIEHATGRKPDYVIGKPEPGMLNAIMEKYQLQPHEVAMIGDRIYTDYMSAYNAKAVGVLVLSGETKMDLVKTSTIQPEITAASLAEFMLMLEASRR